MSDWVIGLCEAIFLRGIFWSHIESGEHDFAGISIGGIEFQVAVDVGEFE